MKAGDETGEDGGGRWAQRDWEGIGLSYRDGVLLPPLSLFSQKSLCCSWCPRSNASERHLQIRSEERLSEGRHQAQCGRISQRLWSLEELCRKAEKIPVDKRKHAYVLTGHPDQMQHRSYKLKTTW